MMHTHGQGLDSNLGRIPHVRWKDLANAKDRHLHVAIFNDFYISDLENIPSEFTSILTSTSKHEIKFCVEDSRCNHFVCMHSKCAETHRQQSRANVRKHTNNSLDGRILER